MAQLSLQEREEAARALARRYLWWKQPDEALADLPRLLCQILLLGTARDYVMARGLWGEERLREALLRAEPGALDERSWHFWHLHFGLPERPAPRRRFDS